MPRNATKGWPEGVGYKTRSGYSMLMLFRDQVRLSVRLREMMRDGEVDAKAGDAMYVKMWRLQELMKQEIERS